MQPRTRKFTDTFGFQIEVGSWILFPWQFGHATILFGKVIGMNRSSTKLLVRLIHQDRHLYSTTQSRAIQLPWYIDDPRPIEYPSNCIALSDEVFARLAPKGLQDHVAQYMDDQMNVLPQHEDLIDVH